MKSRHTTSLMQNHIFRIALGTGLILLIPLVLQLTIGTGVDGQGWNWALSDFVIVGTLIFITGLLLDLAIRKAGRFRAAWIMAIVVAFLYIWAELAVGIFTKWGS